MLFQMPLFFAYYRVLLNAVELRQAHWFWLTDLSSPDPLHILPILIIVSMFLVQFLTPSPGMDPAQRRMMAIMMPVIFGFSMWHFASGLALYWGTGNLINLAIQLGINQSSIGKEMHAIAAKRAAKKSRHEPEDSPGEALDSSRLLPAPRSGQAWAGLHFGGCFYPCSLQRFHNCCKPNPPLSSGIFLKKMPPCSMPEWACELSNRSSPRSPWCCIVQSLWKTGKAASPIPHLKPKKSTAAGFTFSMRSSPGTTRQSGASEIVRDQLYQLYLGRPHGGKLNLTLTSELPGNVLSLSLDPENVTLEAEHFADADPEQFAKRKPLLWFWQMFDRSPIGTNHWLGVRFRCMLGRHIFARMGMGVKIYHGVDLTFGYNLTIEDGVTIRQRALLNDRGGIIIGKGSVIGSFARIYSHTLSAESYERATLVPTLIGAGARIGSHAIVLAGQTVAAGEIVGRFPADRL